MRLKIILVAIILILVLGALFLGLSNSQQTINQSEIQKVEGEITYIPIGDSYTIGNGNLEEDRWPNVMVRHLNEAGIKIRIIASPAVSGYTVEDARVRELPVVKRLKPDFVTVFIGANDNFRGTSPQVYQKELSGKIFHMVYTHSWSEIKI